MFGVGKINNESVIFLKGIEIEESQGHTDVHVVFSKDIWNHSDIFLADWWNNDDIAADDTNLPEPDGVTWIGKIEADEGADGTVTVRQVIDQERLDGRQKPDRGGNGDFRFIDGIAVREYLADKIRNR